jgi:hypothetical protein
MLNSIGSELIDSMLVKEPGTYLGNVDDCIINNDGINCYYDFLETHPVYNDMDYQGCITSRKPLFPTMYSADTNQLLIVPMFSFNQDIFNWLDHSDARFDELTSIKQLQEAFAAKPEILYVLRDPVERVYHTRRENLRHYGMMTAHKPGLADFDPTISIDPGYVSQLALVPFYIKRGQWVKIRNEMKTLITDVYDKMSPDDHKHLWDPYNFWSQGINPKYWLYSAMCVTDMYENIKFFWAGNDNNVAQELREYLEIPGDDDILLHRYDISDAEVSEQDRITSILQPEYKFFEKLPWENK